MDKFERTVMPDGHAARVRDSMGGMWVWDDRAQGRNCLVCDEQITLGIAAYRRPRRPWKTTRDPIMHAKCWKKAGL